MTIGLNVSDLAMARFTLFRAFPSTEKAEFVDGSMKYTLPSMKMPDFMDGNVKQSRIMW